MLLSRHLFNLPKINKSINVLINYFLAQPRCDSSSLLFIISVRWLMPSKQEAVHNKEGFGCHITHNIWMLCQSFHLMKGSNTIFSLGL